MIQEMKYITVTGPISHIDWMIEHYLSRYKIHLEYTIQQFKEVSSGPSALRAFTDDNPYQSAAEQAEFFLDLLGDVPPVYFPMTGKQAKETIEDAKERYESRKAEFRALEESADTITAYIGTLRPFFAFNFEIRQLDKLKFIQCVFGRMPLKNFMQFETFLYEDLPIIFIEAMRDEDTVWGCYFGLDYYECPISAYNFEPISISASCLGEEVPGTPHEIIACWEMRLVRIRAQMQEMLTEDIPQKNALLAAAHTVRSLHKVFVIKQYAARTAGHYIFVGWMPAKEAAAFEKEARNDADTIVWHRDAEGDLPPTKLVNPPVLRWFEFFVRLYGIPQYGEIDPTPILAVFYVLLFGMMFGDVGHGAALALLGWFLLNKSDLGGIMVAAGLSSVFFGFLYGSIFGMEDVFPALWQHPIQNIGDTLMFAVILGAGVILLTMCLNMINAFLAGDLDRLVFSPNGAAGMVLYIILIAAVAGVVPWFIALVPLAVIFARGMAHQETIFQRFMGLFEILLAYLTNTISFVRVGAFALSHAGMMHVVISLSEGMEGRNILILALGNLIVMSIEGLLIGIQSLRLGFYEIFSRFYEGGGRGFEASV